MRVLLVDDDDDLVDVMRGLLADEGARVHVAHSLGEVERQRDDALASDLAILDVNLGAGQPSGVDVFEWLRAGGFAGRVVFLTGHARAHPLVTAAAAIPGTRVLSKPIGLRELEQLVEGGA
jgi:DNA-binding response OmpR family regulator